MRVTNSHLPLVIEAFEAQNNMELPVVVAQNNNLPIVVEPDEANIINDLYSPQRHKTIMQKMKIKFGL